MVIYLGLPLPAGSSDPPESRPGRPVALFSVLLRMGFTYAPPVTGRAVVSYTALPPLPGNPGGTFLLHYPWSRLHRTLSGILPCEARTFLTCPLSGAMTADSRDHLFYLRPFILSANPRSRKHFCEVRGQTSADEPVPV